MQPNAKKREENCNKATCTMAEPSRDGCTTVQEVFLGTRAHSFNESGPDHSGTDHSCPVDAQGGNNEKYSNITSSGKTPLELAMRRRPRDLLDPASMNPEQLTSTSTKQDLLNEEIQKFAMRTHLEGQQRKDILRDLAERTKFVPPDLRARENVLY